MVCSTTAESQMRTDVEGVCRAGGSKWWHYWLKRGVLSHGTATFVSVSTPLNGRTANLFAHFVPNFLTWFSGGGWACRSLASIIEAIRRNRNSSLRETQALGTPHTGLVVPHIKGLHKRLNFSKIWKTFFRQRKELQEKDLMKDSWNNFPRTRSADRKHKEESSAAEHNRVKAQSRWHKRPAIMQLFSV